MNYDRGVGGWRVRTRTRAGVRCGGVRARARVRVTTIACRMRLVVVACSSSCKFLLNVGRYLHITLMSKMTPEATSVASLWVLALVTPIIEVIFMGNKSRATSGKTVTGG